MTESQVLELKVGELFCGAGGLGLGFVLAGHSQVSFRPLFAYDMDPHSVSSYKRNMAWVTEHVPGYTGHSTRVDVADLSQLGGLKILRENELIEGELDVLLGGPPCQGFSSSNRSAGSDKKKSKNMLIKCFLDRVDEIRPKTFVLENVQGIKWTPAYQEMRSECTSTSTLRNDVKDDSTALSIRDYISHRAGMLGYEIWMQVLDAVNFGVPQVRPRFFAIGVRSELVAELGFALGDRLCSSDRVTVNEALGDLPPIENGGSWAGDYSPGQNSYMEWLRGYMASSDLHDHITTRHAPYVIERYRAIPEGKNWEAIRHLMGNYHNVEATHSNIYRRLLRTEPAITISHYRKAMIIHPWQDRNLSFREACRLQSFPDWVRFDGPRDEQQQQLANAVPPLLARAVARALGDWWVSGGPSPLQANESSSVHLPDLLVDQDATRSE